MPRDVAREELCKTINVRMPSSIVLRESICVLLKKSGVSRELGFLAVEVNASDTRNKADNSALKGIGGKLANSIKELATNTAIGTGYDGKRKRVRLVTLQGA